MWMRTQKIYFLKIHGWWANKHDFCIKRQISTECDSRNVMSNKNWNKNKTKKIILVYAIGMWKYYGEKKLYKNISKEISVVGFHFVTAPLRSSHSHFVCVMALRSESICILHLSKFTCTIYMLRDERNEGVGGENCNSFVCALRAPFHLDDMWMLLMYEFMPFRKTFHFRISLRMLLYKIFMMMSVYMYIVTILFHFYLQIYVDEDIDTTLHFEHINICVFEDCVRVFFG